MYKASVLIALFALAGGIFWLGQQADRPDPIPETGLSEVQLLGKHLFEDKNLSEPAGVACASCHEAGKAFQGNNGSRIAAVALGSRPEHFGLRNTPTIMYAALSPAFHVAEEKNDKGEIEHLPTGGQFHDGRAADLAAQAEGPLRDINEMNNASLQVIVDKVKSASYAPLMKRLYGDAVFDNTTEAFAKISAAIASFESTTLFMPYASKFDAVLAGKERFTSLEEKGFALFKDPEKGNCLACHVGKEDSRNPADWLFTDFTYDNFGVPRNHDIPENANATYYDLGLCKQPGLDKHLPRGFDAKTLCGAFKVPTLRNVAVTGPYMHNGFFKDLRDVVKFYATRDTHPELWYGKNPDGSVNKFDDLPAIYHANVNTSEAPYDRKKGETPRLNDADIDAVTAFLKTLTDRTSSEQ